MQKILIIVHAAPYGSERCLSSLRLATALAGSDGNRPEVRMFLMSDATVVALPNQAHASGDGERQPLPEQQRGHEDGQVKRQHDGPAPGHATSLLFCSIEDEV